MKYIGVSVWNYLFNKIDHNCSLVLFKRRLRKYLLFNDISMSVIFKFLTLYVKCVNSQHTLVLYYLCNLISEQHLREHIRLLTSVLIA